jgi:hypothetical protein
MSNRRQPQDHRTEGERPAQRGAALVSALREVQRQEYEPGNRTCRNQPLSPWAQSDNLSIDHKPLSR